MWEDQAGNDLIFQRQFSDVYFHLSYCGQGHQRHLRSFCQRHEAGGPGGPFEFPQGDVHPEAEDDGRDEPANSGVIVRILYLPSCIKLNWTQVDVYNNKKLVQGRTIVELRAIV